MSTLKGRTKGRPRTLKLASCRPLSYSILSKYYELELARDFELVVRHYCLLLLLTQLLLSPSILLYFSPAHLQLNIFSPLSGAARQVTTARSLSFFNALISMLYQRLKLVPLLCLVVVASSSSSSHRPTTSYLGNECPSVV